MNCDKSWHLSKHPVEATIVLTCADCGKVYARCAECNRGVSACKESMQAHVRVAHLVNRKLRQRVMPGREP